jgi:NAD(P) transhydrogenase subunit alpha
VEKDRGRLLSGADVVLMVRGPHSDREFADSQLASLQQDATLLGMFEPLDAPVAMKSLAERHLTVFSMELMPRTTRAQVMDVLSSMATIAGYKAVVLAAEVAPKIFPMLTTAAGTIAPARVFVLGVGVAGLQAIATARRLGAVASAYDVRPAVKEQVESLGARFVELGLESQSAEAAGGYAAAQSEEFYRRQQDLLAQHLRAADVIITTAAVPGKRAPVLITTRMMTGMTPGTVIVDLAAERGGNCEATQPGEVVVRNGVTILGPLNLAATAPIHASQMYSKNISNFLLYLVKDGKLRLDREDEITRGTLVTHEGQVVHPMVLEALARAGSQTP